MSATINQSSRTRRYLYERYPSGMAKKRKSKWDRKRCGCVKTVLVGEPAVIRCKRHQAKPAKGHRVPYILNDEGIVERA